MLIFSHLPRFNLFLSEDSSGLLEKFFRSLARRTFMEHARDTRPCGRYDPKVRAEVSVGEASALLSGIMFIDLGTERYHVFFNPRAKHRILQHRWR
jgi:hypothetical protein